jgi:hypothetical protein
MCCPFLIAPSVFYNFLLMWASFIDRENTTFTKLLLLFVSSYEPEAAAIYCKELTVQKKEDAEGSILKSFELGQQFLETSIKI